VIGFASLGLALLAGAHPAAARDYFGVTGGYVAPLGTTADFSGSGYTIEARWRHHNKGRSAFELELGYIETELEGEVQETIANFEALARQKNELAQLQGGPGDGWMVAEYGTLNIFHFGPNYLFFPMPKSRLSPFVSFGAGVYDWRLPFRLKFYRTPFFGEQHAYDPPSTGALYAGIVPEEAVDFTKHETSGGISIAGGFTFRMTNSLEIGGTARAHLIFSNGEGNKELGVDNQDYLDNMTLLALKGALQWRF
jgi:hypothetical protein